MLSACAPCIGCWTNPIACSGQDQDPSDGTIAANDCPAVRNQLQIHNGFAEWPKLGPQYGHNQEHIMGASSDNHHRSSDDVQMDGHSHCDLQFSLSCSRVMSLLTPLSLLERETRGEIHRQ